MGYREVTMLELKEVLRLWLSGMGKKRIAAQLGLDVKTVRRYIRVAESCGLTPASQRITDEQLAEVIVTSNRGPDEWLATFADPVDAQSAIDRFTSNSYDLVIDGESYRRRLEPDPRTGQRKTK